MHVCHFCDTSVAGEYFRNITLGLTRKGVRVSLVELGQGASPKWLANVSNASYFCLNASSKLHYPMAIWKLIRLLKSEDVDILHTHLFFAGLIGVLAKQFHGKIVVLMRHHTSIVRMLGSKIHVMVDKWMAEKADYVITVSEAARRYMIETEGIRQGSIEVIHLGFDFERFSPNAEDRIQTRREFGIGEDEFVIGYVGNFAPGKGHLQLVEAFSKVIGCVANARLLLVGRGSLASVTQAVERLSLQEKVIFAGWREDVSACLNAMDLFVQPSLSEAFSQVLVESMGVGLPVIATDVGGAKEVITNGENGFLIEPGMPTAIYEKTLMLAANKELRERIAFVGQQFVKDRFTVKNMVEAHYELYKRWMAIQM